MKSRNTDAPPQTLTVMLKTQPLHWDRGRLARRRFITRLVGRKPDLLALARSFAGGGARGPSEEVDLQTHSASASLPAIANLQAAN